jgi:RNA polymerase sigma-70 factor (ECF subfamily)
VVDDRELMIRVKDGEQTALEYLFTRWEGRLFAFFYRSGCPPSYVEDLTQEALVSVYRRRQRYDPDRPFAPWIYGIARLVWKDYLRHHGREKVRAVPLEVATRVPSSEPSPSGVAEAREEAERVRAAIEALPEEQRVTFILRHYEGLSYEEISQALEVPLGTVKWRIHEAVRRLESLLLAGSKEGQRG